MSEKGAFAGIQALNLVPMVVEQTRARRTGLRYLFPFVEGTVVFLVGAVEDYAANLVVAQLLFLEADNPDKDIHLYINSPGGSVGAGLAIYDTMQFVKPSVSTMCVGQAASMGALLLAGGAPGKRFFAALARYDSSAAGRFSGRPAILTSMPEILLVRDRLNRILAKHTGQPIERSRSIPTAITSWAAPRRLSMV